MAPRPTLKSRLFAILLLAPLILAANASPADAARRAIPGPLQWLQALEHPKHPRSHRRAQPRRARPKPASPVALPKQAPVPTPSPQAAAIGKDEVGPPDEASGGRQEATVPVPVPRPAARATEPEQPIAAPEPTGSPAKPEQEGQATEGKQALAVPLPTPRPTASAPPAGGPEAAEPPSAETDRSEAALAPSEDEPPLEEQYEIPNEPVLTAEQEEACRGRLKALGVTFIEAAPRSDAIGCRMDRPITVSGLGPGIRLEPAATMTCPLAEAAARFAQDVIAPAAEKSFRSSLASIGQASAYVCRPRAGTTKLSEHAFGNALDISTLTLANGQRVEVKAESEPVKRDFLAELRISACGPFRTVLGPGDAGHAEHFHFDLAHRRGNASYCQ